MSDEPTKQETETAAPAAAAAEGEAPAVESEEAAAPEEESTATFAPVVRFLSCLGRFARDAVGHWPWLHQQWIKTPLTLIAILIFRVVSIHQVQLAEVEVVTGEDDEVRKNDDK
jgi:hypothetical protein